MEELLCKLAFHGKSIRQLWPEFGGWYTSKSSTGCKSKFTTKYKWFREVEGFPGFQNPGSKWGLLQIQIDSRVQNADSQKKELQATKDQQQVLESKLINQEILIKQVYEEKLRES